MNKHSPGPWSASYGGKWAWITDANGRCVTVDAKTEDARLIAAAPEMLELLREAFAWLEDASGYAQDGEPRRFDDRVRALLERIDRDRP